MLAIEFLRRLAGLRKVQFDRVPENFCPYTKGAPIFSVTTYTHIYTHVYTHV